MSVVPPRFHTAASSSTYINTTTGNRERNLSPRPSPYNQHDDRINSSIINYIVFCFFLRAASLLRHPEGSFYQPPEGEPCTYVIYIFFFFCSMLACSPQTHHLSTRFLLRSTQRCCRYITTQTLVACDAGGARGRGPKSAALALFCGIGFRAAKACPASV